MASKKTSPSLAAFSPLYKQANFIQLRNPSKKFIFLKHQKETLILQPGALCCNIQNPELTQTLFELPFEKGPQEIFT
jgi:hypothetical protein